MQEKPNGYTAAVVMFIEALLMASIASGFLRMDSATAQLWVNVAAAGVAIVAPAIGFWWAKRYQTPLVNPVDSDGAPLKREDGAMPLKQAEYIVSKKS